MNNKKKKNKVKTKLNKVKKEVNKVKKEIIEYKKNKIKKLIIPQKHDKTFIDSDDERRYHDIHTLKNAELDINVKNQKSPQIKHYEKIYYIY